MRKRAISVGGKEREGEGEVSVADLEERERRGAQKTQHLGRALNHVADCA